MPDNTDKAAAAAQPAAQPVRPAASVQTASAPAPVAPSSDQGLIRELVDALRGDAERNRIQALDALARERHLEDEARARGPKEKRVAITSFTVFDDANPTGRVVRAGEEFEVAAVDMHKFSGKTLQRAPDASVGGVTISSAAPTQQPA
jgi:hypothetical protein